jgi:hypothetical protein
MEGKSLKDGLRPQSSPRPDPVVGDWGRVKSERGRLSLAPLGSEGRDGSPNGSNASDVSIVVKKYRRFVAYRVTGFDGVVRVVAELLFKISRIARGSVVYLNGRRMRVLLGLDAPFHPIDLSVVYEVLSRLGFEVVRRRGKYVVIRMDNPIMREVKGARSFDEVLEIVKKHLSNGG